MKYCQIEDLPQDWKSLAAADLPNLAENWFERQEDLKNSNSLREFNEKLIREWSIEAGTLEKLYEIDRGVTITLIEQGLDASLIPFNKTNKPVSYVIKILNDHKVALEGVFSFVKEQRQLSTSYVKELHEALLRSQTTTEGVDQFGNMADITLIRGDWKKLSNNPTRPDGNLHEYCPPIFVQDEIDRLLSWHTDHMEMGVPPEIEAAWLHHRFTQIHPFQDGNGRVARALASLIFLRAGWFPLVFHEDKRTEYIDALEKADVGNLKPLVDLFAQVERKSFNRALSISDNILDDQDEQYIQQIIKAAGKVLDVRSEIGKSERQQKSQILENITYDYFQNKLVPILQKELQARDPNYSATVQHNTETNSDWYHKQIIQIAKELEYFADWRTYRAWVVLKIKEERQAHLVLSFHCLGAKSKDLMAISAFIEYRDRNEIPSFPDEPDGPYRICKEIFQFSAKEDKEPLKKRFEEWLKEIIIIGLEQWRRQL